MSRKLLVLAMVLALSSIATLVCAQQYEWDLFNEFSIDNGNPNGPWSYGCTDYNVLSGPGYTVTLHDMPFGSMADLAGWTLTRGGNANYLPYSISNRLPTVGTYPASSVVFSAGASGVDLKGNDYSGSDPYEHVPYSVFRWTAPASGFYKVDASFQQMVGASTWTGRMDCHLLIKGVARFSCIVNGLAGDITVGPGPFIYSGVFRVEAGETVDWVGGPYTYYYSDFTDVKGHVTALAGLGIIAGKVTANTDGHPVVSGVKVEALDTNASSITNEAGEYLLALPPGTYTIKASIDPPTLKEEQVANVAAVADQTTTVDFDLDLRDPVQYYINNESGSDTNDGKTPETAWKTIDNGDKLDVLLAGDVVNVAPGQYDQVLNTGVTITSTGNANQRLTYRKDPNAGSGKITIDMTSAPADDNGQKYGIFVNGDYVTIDGFEVKNASWGVAVINGHRDSVIANCEIHAIRPGKPNLTANDRTSDYCKCAGIFCAVASNAAIHNNLIYDIGYSELPNIAACITTPSCTNVKIYNNTLVGGQSGIASWNNAESAIEFKNNIVANMRGFGIDPSYKWAEDNAKLTHASNFYFGNASDFGWANPTWGAGEFNCNPQLATDYTLQTGSAATNAGVDVGLAFQGSAPDLGAFETGSTAATNAIVQGTVTANVAGHPAVTRATISSGTAILGASDTQGRFKFPVNAGTYSLKAARGGFVEKTSSVTASGTVTKDFDLDKGTGSTWYVNSGSGDDGNDGMTPSTAWATISRGDVLGVVKPGDNVLIAEGSYSFTPGTTGAYLGVRFSKCFGESCAPITYKADGVVTINQDGVQAGDKSSYGVDIDVDNMALVKNNAGDVFDISTAQYGVVVRSGRAGNTVADCFVHNISQPSPGMGTSLSAAAGIYAGGTDSTTIRNNVVASVGHSDYATDPAAGVEVADSTNAKVYNNTIDAAPRGIWILGTTTGTDVKNNILSYYATCGLLVEVLGSGVTHGYNLFSPASEGVASLGGFALPGPVELTGDPQFVSAGVDFSLSAGSPAINVGVNVGLPFTGAAPDLGAFETSETGGSTQYGFVKGTVRYRSSGAPAADVWASIVGENSVCVTGTDGTYALAVIPGSYAVQAVKSGYAPKSADITISAGQTITKDFYLSPGTGGIISLADDFSISGNPNGDWSYGESNSLDPATFALLPDSVDCAPDGYPGTYAWTNKTPGGFPQLLANTSDQVAFNLYPPHSACMHPGNPPDVGSNYCIARWTAPSAGWYEVYVQFGAPWYTVQTTDCHVFVNTAQVFNGILDGTGRYTLNYAGRFQFSGGDSVDAWVGNNGGYSSDTTPVSLIILTTDTDPADVDSIAAAKDYGDNKLVAFTTDEIVTVGSGTFADGSCYIEDADRMSGIKVIRGSGVATIAKGDKIKFQGYMGTDDNGERFITITSITSKVAGGSVSSLGMTNKSFGAGQSGILVRVWGKVTEKAADGSYCLIDDGSGTAVKVILNAATITKTIALGKTIGFTGPAGLSASGSTLTPAVRARSNDDIVVYN